MKKGFKLFGILISIALILTGCGVKISDVEMVLPNEIMQGESVQTELLVQTENEVDEAKKQEALRKLGAVWASSDESVATVDQNGKVTAVNGGKVTISVTAGEFTKSFELNISVPLQGLTAEKELKLAINKAPTSNVNAKPNPENADFKGTIVYKSSDEKIATVDEKGNVTAVVNGEVTITSTLDGKTATTKIIVNTAATGIKLAATEGILYVGGSFTISASLEPTEAGEGKFTYTSSDESIATVDENGTLTAKAVGTAAITVKNADGLSAEYTLTVRKKAAGGTGTAGGTVGGASGSGSTTSPNNGDNGGATAPGVPSEPISSIDCPHRNTPSAGHGSAGVCPVCGVMSSGSIVSPPDDQQGDGYGGDGGW